MSSPESELERAVTAARPQLDAISEDNAALPRVAGGWSRKEIIGHLIDSAAINHERFVRAQFTEDLICPTYDQDAWVRVQRYCDAPWSELVSLWTLYNLQLARVIGAIPKRLRTMPRSQHNLDQAAFRPVPASEPATLEYFMRDYVLHLGHHVAQILKSFEVR